MKILNLKRRLAALLAAIGMIPASWVWSADLQTNLVVNPSFEIVDEGETGEYNSVRLLEWDDVDGNDADTFAYAYSQNYSGTPNPPGAGNYHFMGGRDTEVDVALISQLIPVGSGPSGAAIASGKARYDLRAFFSSYQNQDEASRVRVRFLNGNTELGTAQVGGSDFLQGLPILPPDAPQRFWGQDASWGTIPATTTAVEVEIVPDGGAGFWDGYVDLIDFRVGGLPSNLALQLEVNTTTGAVRVQNLTGAAVDLDYYEILSPAGSLSTSGWQSLQDQDLEGSGGTSGNGDGWEEAGGSSGNVLSESFLLGQSRLNANGAWQLGQAFRPGRPQDLVFRYGVSDGLLLYGLVKAIDTGLAGDYSGNGTLDAADLDLQAVAMVGGQNPKNFDLNGDNLVDFGDREMWLHDLKKTWVGDANLDLVFDSNDFVQVFVAGKYETGGPAQWEEGDWNGDRLFDTNDFVAAFVDGGYEIGQRPGAVSAVPEPSTIGLSLLAVGPMLLAWRTRRR